MRRERPRRNPESCLTRSRDPGADVQACVRRAPAGRRMQCGGASLGPLTMSMALTSDATPEDVLRLVRDRGLLTLTSAGRSPSLVEEVAGEPVKGSWWGHPASERIFKLASALEASPEILVVKLVGAKVTFLHRTLWPALARIARDPERVAEVRERLSPAAVRLLAEVERVGEVRLDELARQPAWPPERDLARAAKELEATLLAHTGSVHTDRGRHAIVLRSWARALPDSARRDAAHLTLEAARAALESHGAAPALSVYRPPRARAR